MRITPTIIFVFPISPFSKLEEPKVMFFTFHIALLYL